MWNRTHDLAFEASADSPDAGVVWSSTASHLAAEQRYEYVVEATLGDEVVDRMRVKCQLPSCEADLRHVFLFGSCGHWTHR